MYALGPGLSHCVIDGTVIFLDTPRDRYFGLTPAASQRFLALLDQATPTLAANGGDANIFLARGLLVETDEAHGATIPIAAAPTGAAK